MGKSILIIILISFGNCFIVQAQHSMNKTEITEHVEFEGWQNCVKLSNGSIELVVTTDVGPRIIHFGFINGRNMFYVDPSEKGKTGGDEWRLYGGHRFWRSPEVMPETYLPDNAPVKYSWNGETLKLTQQAEPLTLIVKEMEITLKPDKNEVEVLHRMINKSCWSVELAPWAISACAPGGLAIVPQEPYIDPDDYLLPIRPVVLWAYTKMDDLRYHWGEKFILAKYDSNDMSETKIGVLNKQKWAAFYLNEDLFIKRFDYFPDVLYPDYGCNNEIYINGNFLEVESLGPLTKIAPLSSIEHIENWKLFKIGKITWDDEEKINILIEPISKLSFKY
jgi:hypothetical protein